jgi:hypothetical protein
VAIKIVVGAVMPCRKRHDAMQQHSLHHTSRDVYEVTMCEGLHI